MTRTTVHGIPLAEGLSTASLGHTETRRSPMSWQKKATSIYLCFVEEERGVDQLGVVILLGVCEAEQEGHQDGSLRPDVACALE